MNGDAVITALRAVLLVAGVRTRVRQRPAMHPALELGVRAHHWQRAAKEIHAQGWRLSSLWAEEHGRSILLTVLVEHAGAYVALRTRVRAQSAVLDSIARIYPGADRLERHARDLLGLEFENHPDPRRWTRHQAWSAVDHPLQADRPAGGEVAGTTPPDTDYPFQSVAGPGVYEIPVGPVHAGIIEPGHFRFQAVGEEILRLEERLGYVHKGIEKIAVGRDANGLTRLAARVSGDTAAAHAWAACMAMEQAAGVGPPPRAVHLRAVLAEIERVVNHLWDIAAVCNDVAFSFAHYQLGRVVEDWRRVNALTFGHRLLMDTLMPGGVRVDLDAGGKARILAQCTATRREISDTWLILQDNASLHDRLAAAGVLSQDDARALGTLGYVGRASGQDFDVRRDAPYPPYADLGVESACIVHGDIAARVRVRHDEILVSLDLLERLIETLPRGEIQAHFDTPSTGAEGLGIVDGWRGEIVTYVRFGSGGVVERFFPRDPSWMNWPALERLIHGNIVPDFPVCNKSVNGSYSGHDL